MPKHPLFRIWQPTEENYHTLCTHLGLTPQSHIYRRLVSYLESAPFCSTTPHGFGLHLARLPLTLFRVKRLDLASKFLFPSHPVRHQLNAIIALHECDPKGYQELTAAPQGIAAWLKMAGWGLSFAISALITPLWLGWHFIGYLAGPPLKPLRKLHGKRLLITGVSRGLGRELMLQALEQGAEVIGTVRNDDAVKKLRKELPEKAPITLIAADLSQRDALVEALGARRITPETVDMAILCAGIKLSDTSILDSEGLRQTFEVNTFSNMDLAAWLYRSNHPSILVLISSMGRWHGMHSSCGYNASKAALSIWGESLEMEQAMKGRKGCHLLLVEPGLFTSDMVSNKGLSGLLAVSREDLALRILAGAMAGRKVVRHPFWFALLTWGVCLGGRSLRMRLFARVKEKGNK